MEIESRNDEVTISSVEELTRLFADLSTQRRRFFYRGIPVESFSVFGYGSTIGLLLGWLFYAFMRRWERPTRGIHAKVTLPVAVTADLRLESLGAPRKEGDDALASHFMWTATSDERVRRYLGDTLGETLVQLSTDYWIVMDDETIQIGPLMRTPAEDAAAIDKLVNALPHASAEVSDCDAAEAAPDEDDAELTVLCETTSRVEADLWRTMLETAEIPCASEGYETSPPWGAATPPMTIQLLVPTTQFEAARAVIKRAASDGEMNVCHNCGEAIAEDTETCPACGFQLGSEVESK